MTTILLSGGDLGSETIRVRCDLSRAESPVEADYGTGDGWQPTQYQCADCRHCNSGLAAIGRRLAAAAVEMPAVACDAETVSYLPCCHCDGTGTIEAEGQEPCECSACDGTGDAQDD